jgi:hypothetical protein
MLVTGIFDAESCDPPAAARHQVVGRGFDDEPPAQDKEGDRRGGRSKGQLTMLVIADSCGGSKSYPNNSFAS